MKCVQFIWLALSIRTTVNAAAKRCDGTHSFCPVDSAKYKEWIEVKGAVRDILKIFGTELRDWHLERVWVGWTRAGNHYYDYELMLNGAALVKGTADGATSHCFVGFRFNRAGCSPGKDKSSALGKYRCFGMYELGQPTCKPRAELKVLLERFGKIELR